jgi:co-chaperonin GroES (HSP10)
MPGQDEDIFGESGFAMEGIGYYRQAYNLEDIHPGRDWVVVLEHLAREPAGILELFDRDRSTLGHVVAVGERAASQHGLRVGDAVVYEEFMGGRWQFPMADGGECRVLIMHVDWVFAKLRYRFGG